MGASFSSKSATRYRLVPNKNNRLSAQRLLKGTRHPEPNIKEETLLSAQPPSRPISPFFPKNAKQLLNLIKIFTSLGYSLLSHKSIIWGYPVTAHIEPTSLCNLKCPLCPTGAGHLTRKRATLQLNDYKKILDKLPESIRMILLWNQGEPFMVKELPEMISYAKQKNIYMVTSTNGHFFRKESSAKKLVDSGLDELIISLDGADQKTYQKYRVGGKLSWVFEGIDKIAEAKSILGKSSPIIHLQFILMRHNLDQQDAITKIGKKLGADKISFKTMQMGDFLNADEYLPDNPQYTRYQSMINKTEHRTRKRRIFPNNCLRLWYSVVINCDGSVSPCCFDKDGEHAIGNILEESFDSIWFGKKFSRFRQGLLNSRYALDMCRDCSEGVKNLFVKTIKY